MNMIVHLETTQYTASQVMHLHYTLQITNDKYTLK